MAAPNKNKYMQKTVAFNGKQMTLFSLDGITWSSRKDELAQILERHEQERANIGELKNRLLRREADEEGEGVDGGGEARPVSENSDYEADGDELEEAEEELGLPSDEDDEDGAAAAGPKGRRGRSAGLSRADESLDDLEPKGMAKAGRKPAGTKGGPPSGKNSRKTAVLPKTAGRGKVPERSREADKAAAASAGRGRISPKKRPSAAPKKNESKGRKKRAAA